MTFYISSKMFSYAQEAISIKVNISVRNLSGPEQIPTSLLSILSSFLNSDGGRSHIYYHHSDRDEIWRWYVISRKIQTITIYERKVHNVRRELMYDSLQKHYLIMKPTLTLKLI